MLVNSHADALVLDVMDSNVIKDRRLGSWKTSVDELNLVKRHRIDDAWRPLKENSKQKGEILLDMAYFPLNKDTAESIVCPKTLPDNS